jgi:hypothetical protein
VSGQPPAQPQISADGKFYWDGQRWVPMQQAAPVPAQATSHRGRNLGLGCVGLIVLVIAIGVIGSNSSKNQPALKWDVSGRHTSTSTVGGTDALQVTVTNNGSAASNLILYLNAHDDWFKHHVITDPGGCSINKNLERLDCGPLAAGETKTINVEGSPKDAGNFDFELDVADEEGSQLLYPDKGALTWSETVTQ